MAESSQPFSLVKYAKARVVSGANEDTMSLRFLQHAAEQQQDDVFGGCGPVNDPVLMELMQHACKEAALSQIDKEQILNAIVPPREWEEDGKKMQQLISKDPPTRFDVVNLNSLLNAHLTNRQARPDGICPIRRELADQCFDELIRQVVITQAERGLLLLRTRDELKMTLSAYQDLFVSSRDYDSRTTVGKHTMTAHAEIQSKNKELEELVAELDKEYNYLLSTYEHNAQTFTEERESAAKKHYEEFQFLKRVNNALKQQIDAMIDPVSNTDPVIEAYQGVKGKEGRPARIKKICQ